MNLTILADENIPGVEHYFPAGCRVKRMHGRSITAQHLHNVDVLLVRSVTRVGEDLLEGSRISFVGSATSGIDHIDRDYLASRDIAFAYAPGSNANSVVEYVLAAIASVGKHLETLLQGGTFGVVGYGFVGRALVARLHSLGIDCKVYDPWLDHSQLPNPASLSQVLACDVLSLHCELTEREPFPSYHLLGVAELAQLARGGLLINASRGAVVDNQALLQRLTRSPGLDVVLDVWEGEPNVSSQLLQQVRLGTAHIAGYSLDGKLLATRMLAEAMAQHYGGPAPEGASPIAQAPVLEMPAVDTAARVLRDMLSARYDILEDDRLLRQTISQGKDTGFDTLRKNYAVRRELATSRVAVAGTGTELVRAMGAVPVVAGEGE